MPTRIFRMVITIANTLFFGSLLFFSTGEPASFQARLFAMTFFVLNLIVLLLELTKINRDA